MQSLIKNKRIKDAATPTLLHPDFNMRNIYVSVEEPTVITGLIDWQSASIELAFLYSNETPDFASLPELPGDGTSENAESEQRVDGHKEKERKDASICY